MDDGRRFLLSFTSSSIVALSSSQRNRERSISHILYYGGVASLTMRRFWFIEVCEQTPQLGCIRFYSLLNSTNTLVPYED
jgi:hypothetical protein